MESGDGEALLRQFCRLGVGEKDELVAKMREALGLRVSAPAAAFYLDMFDWNLHAAVGFYLDSEAAACPRMSLLPQQPSDAVTSRPGVSVEWAWSVTNDGEGTWPEGCSLRPVGGAELFDSCPEPVRSLGPGDTGHLAISFTAPANVGMHCQQYRLCTPQGLPFGEALWISIIVEGENQPAVQQPVDTISDYNMC